MPERPQSDPQTDSLNTLAEAERDAALRRFEALRPHIQDGAALTEAARAANVPVRSLQRWVARYRKSGLAGLARQQRSRCIMGAVAQQMQGAARLPPALVGAIEGLALCTPRLTAGAIHRRLRTVAGAQGWPMPRATPYAYVEEFADGPWLTSLRRWWRSLGFFW